MRRFDPIAVVEHAYDLDAADDRWLETLTRTAHPDLALGEGLCWFFSMRDRGGVHVTSPMGFFGATAASMHFAKALHENTPDAVVETFYAPVAFFDAISADTGALAYFHAIAKRSGVAFVDALGLRVGDGYDKSITIAAPSLTPATPTRQRRTRWLRLATHLGAALRLRRRFHERSRVTHDPVALLDPDGKVVHLADGVASNTRKSLTHAVRTMERARGSLRRRSPDEALALWQGLVAGRYSVVDWVDSDARRFLVAVDNAVFEGGPRALSRREREVVEFAMHGRSNREIAYALGLGEGTVARTIRDSLRKLGGARRQDLAALFGGHDVLVGRVADDPQIVAIASTPRFPTSWEDLSSAERAVVELALRGRSDEEIARERGTSLRTIGNQLSRVYRRLGVAGRTELAALLGTQPSARGDD